MESSVENLDPNDAKVEVMSIDDAASRADASKYVYVPKLPKAKKYVPVPAPETSFLGNFAFGAYSAVKEIPALPYDLGVFANNIIYGFGDYFGASPQTIERAKLNMDTYSRNSQMIRNNIYSTASPEIMETWGAKAGSATANFLIMFAGGGLSSVLAKGASVVAKVVGKKTAKESAQETSKGIAFDVGSIGTGTALEITSEQLEGIPINEDGSIKWEDYSAQQARTEALGTTTYGIASAFLEKYFGIGLQKKIWTAPVKFTTKGVKGAAAEVGYSIAKTAASEYATEDLQSLANAGIDLIDGSITFSKLPERLQQEFVDNLVTILPSGMVATGTAITKRAAIKKDLTEMVAPVVKDEAKTKEIVDEIYDGAITNLKDTVSIELELSSELREKHGAIMNSMTQAVEQAVQFSEAIMAMPEEERAQYIAETAKNFADQVLGEANLRGVTIDEVLKASDIQYRDGKLYMKAGEDVKEVDLSFSGMVKGLQKKDITFDALARRLNDIGIDSKEYFQVADENAKLDEQYPAYEGDTITVNGVERSVYNSNGERINQSAEALTNFWNWFGDSKVVDKQGRPLVVYHGTSDIFDTFDISKIGEHGTAEGNGFYFVTSKIFAKDYAKERWVNGKRIKGTIMPVYLNLQNPVDFAKIEGLRGKTEEQIRKIGNDLISKYVENDESKKQFLDGIDFAIREGKGTDITETINLITRTAEIIGDEKGEKSGYEVAQDARDMIVKELGIDGFFRKMPNNRGTIYVAFNPNQIKSVNNSGAYGETENIYYQSAYHGTPHPELEGGRFSLEKIGTGEGAQAHGHGLYYSLGRDVAEGYRAKLLGFDKLTVKNQDRIKEIINSKGRKFYQESLSNLDELLKKNRELNTKINGLSDEIENLEYENFVSKNGEPESYTFDFKPNKDLYKTTQAEELEKEQNKLIKENKSVQESINKILDDFDELSDLTFNLLNSTEEINWMRKIINNVDNKGQIYEVDIPENPYLLDEQKPYREQSDFVKDALQKAISDLDKPNFKEKIFDNREDAIDFYDSKIDEFEEKADGYQRFMPQSFLTDDGKFGVKYVDDYTVYEPIMGENTDITGGGIYSKIAHRLGSQKDASQYLEKHGIKGITYFGRQDGRCFVIFNPDDVKIIQKFYQGERQIKGSFNARTKAIELLEGADVSTLPHELAHFWLDNMWTYVHSGKASDAYNKRFDAVRDWLGITPDQKILKPYQQERFARGYERYLLEGFSPSPLISDAFDDYGRWLRKVYEDAARLGRKLSPEVVEFFNSMVTGGVKAPENYVTSETMQKRIAEKVEENEKVTKEIVVEKQKQFDAPAEVTSEDTKQGYSRFWERNKGEVGGVGSIMYDVKENADQIKKATEFVDNNLEAAKKISDGEMEAPKDIVSTFIRLAYIEKMKQIGDMEETRRAMENLSRDATEEGQRIQALSAVSYLQDYYWVNSAIKNRQEYVALKNFANADNPVKKLQEAIDAKINKYIDEFLSLDAKGQTELAKKIVDEAGAELGEEDTFYQEEIRTPIKEKKSAEQKLRDLIERRVGSNITDEQFQTLLKKHADMINALENTSDEGNPSKLFFKNLSDLENYRNSLAPASTLKVLVSVAGRGSMLASIKSPLLNIDSNIIEAGLSAIIRRAVYKTQGKSIKSLIDKSEYKKYIKNSWDIYKASGYMISTMSEINPDKLIRGEKITSTAGRTGNALGDLIRRYGQLHEQTVFKYLMGAPDTISKDITFVDTVALEASQRGKTKAKATELFRDACLIEPKTEEGKQIRAIAVEQAMITTYTNNSAISQALLGIRRELNKFGSIGDVISPFVKTPANVQMLGIKYAYGLVSPAITFIQKARNLKKITPENIKEIAKASFSDNSVTIARNILGVVLSAGIIATLIDDEDYIPDYVLLTPAERELVKEKGLAFNSVNIFGTWVNLEYFGGLAMPLTAILNARRQTGVLNTVRGYVTGGAAQLLALPVIGDVKEFIANAADIITSQEDMDKIIGRVEDGLIDFISGRAIPAIIPDFAKLIDKYERDTMRNALGRVESKLPFVRENLPPIYEKTTGEPKEREIKAFFFGSRVKTGIQNALTDEFTRLQKEGQAVNLSDPTRTGDLSLLSDEQKADIKKEFAERYSQKVSSVIESGSYSNKSDEDKKKRINEIRSDIIYKIRREYKHEIKEAKELKEADKL